MCHSQFVLGGLSALLVAATAGVSTLAAQDTTQEESRNGSWSLALGLGAGSGRINCDRCGRLDANDPWDGGTGASGYLAIGRSITPGLTLAGELNGWAKVRRSEGTQRDATLFLLSAVARYRPLQAAGFFMKGGAGIGGSILAGGPGLIESGGWGILAGGGYAVSLRERIVLAPFVSYVHIFSSGSVGTNRGDPAVGPRNPRYVQLGLSLSRHWGAR